LAKKGHLRIVSAFLSCIGAAAFHGSQTGTTGCLVQVNARQKEDGVCNSSG